MHKKKIIKKKYPKKMLNAQQKISFGPSQNFFLTAKKNCLTTKKNEIKDEKNFFLPPFCKFSFRFRHKFFLHFKKKIKQLGENKSKKKIFSLSFISSWQWWQYQLRDSVSPVCNIFLCCKNLLWGLLGDSELVLLFFLILVFGVQPTLKTFLKVIDWSFLFVGEGCQNRNIPSHLCDYWKS